MLRVSKMADYATVIMVYLARKQALCSVSDIAQATHLAKPTVSKLLKRLTKANLLRSQLGAKGGYLLNYQEDAISLADIVTAIDMYSGLTECSYQKGQCALEQVCDVRDHWQSVSQVVHRSLKNISLKSLAMPKMNLGEPHDRAS